MGKQGVEADDPSKRYGGREDAASLGGDDGAEEGATDPASNRSF